jgi:segregation and condensation protein A
MVSGPETALSNEIIEADDALVVDVDGYEGPLHLLLDLARRQKVDLLKVSVLKLSEQYLHFIRQAKDSRIDLAAEYLVMAAWLALLKSRLLLPKPQKAEGDEEVSGEDMVRRLAFRLKRLEAMRTAVDDLFDGELLGRDVFARGLPERPKVVRQTEYYASLHDLAKAFGTIRARKEKEKPHTVEKQFVLPLEVARDRLKEVAPKLDQWRAIQSLAEDFDEAGDLPGRTRLASVFSATLELARDGDVQIQQDAHFAPLYLRAPQAGAGEGDGEGDGEGEDDGMIEAAA